MSENVAAFSQNCQAVASFKMATKTGDFTIPYRDLGRVKFSRYTLFQSQCLQCFTLNNFFQDAREYRGCGGISIYAIF